MNRSRVLNVILLKPSKYGPDGFVERFRKGFMPNSTLHHLQALTPETIDNRPVNVRLIDESVQCDLDYLTALNRSACDLLALVGVQSHQFHRALDLASFALDRGVPCTVVGGPHPMTCRTDEVEYRDVSFALAEGEMIWEGILQDAASGRLEPTYGADRRWQPELSATVLTPPLPRDLKRYVVPMLGVYPARGCPFLCNFCSVIQIAGRRVRRQPTEAIIETLQRAKAAGVRKIMFTSDNFNKMPGVRDLLEAIVRADINLPFFVQCDVQIAKDELLVALLAKAVCFMMFVGVESFDRQTLIGARKTQNRPEHYGRIIELCHRYGIVPYFSNMIGFPDQTEDGILAHLEALERLDPAAVSFYILTPIPGTEQYADFKAKGLLTEPNLDRYDGTAVTWNHPYLSPDRLRSLLSTCYQRHHAAQHLIRRALSSRWKHVRGFSRLNYLEGAVFERWSCWRGEHPMSGGIGRVRLDHVRDYLPLRRARYGFDLAPLPNNRRLSAADEAINRSVSLIPA